MFDKKTFGERVRLLRTLRNESQQTLATGLGIGKSAVSMIESGQRAASADILIALADYFDVPMDYLVGRGLFSTWDEIMEHKELIINTLQLASPYFKSLPLDTLDEYDLIRLFPAIFARIVCDGDEVYIYPRIPIDRIGEN